MNPDRLAKAIQSLADLVTRLRGPGGCPWDAKQTDDDVKIYLLEEAYEVLDAIEKSSPHDVCSELGDLLFQISFLARTAAERNEFDFVDVVESITEKMIRRHPHVFGHTEVSNAEEVSLNWAEIKKKEKGHSHDAAFFIENVPADLPALLRAHRLQERVSKIASAKEDIQEVENQIQSCFDALKAEAVKSDEEAIVEKMGDLFFRLVTLCRLLHLNAEHVLRVANQKYLKRFVQLVHTLNASGIQIDKATPNQIDRAWHEIKQQQK